MEGRRTIIVPTTPPSWRVPTASCDSKRGASSPTNRPDRGGGRMRPLGPGREVVPGVRMLAHLHRSNALDVYDASCERRAARVVLKTPRPGRLNDARTVCALLCEGRLLERLSHPNLVRAYGVHAAPRPAVILETLRGAAAHRGPPPRRSPPARRCGQAHRPVDRPVARPRARRPRRLVQHGARA